MREFDSQHSEVTLGDGDDVGKLRELIDKSLRDPHGANPGMQVYRGLVNRKRLKRHLVGVWHCKAGNCTLAQAFKDGTDLYLWHAPYKRPGSVRDGLSDRAKARFMTDGQAGSEKTHWKEHVEEITGMNLPGDEVISTHVGCKHGRFELNISRVVSLVGQRQPGSPQHVNL